MLFTTLPTASKIELAEMKPVSSPARTYLRTCRVGEERSQRGSRRDAEGMKK